MYNDRLDNIADKYNNTCSTIKMMSVGINTITSIGFDVEHNDKDPKFKVGDDVRISKYKNVFAKGYKLNWLEEVFVIKNVI